MNETGREGNETRAIVAILLSLAVFWLWSSWFAPKPPIEPTPAPDEATAQVPPFPAPAPTATPAPDAGSPPPAVATPTQALPEATGTFTSPGWTGQWTTRGGVLRRLELPDYPSSTEVTTIYGWVWNRIRGRTTEPWQPYRQSEDPARILGEAGAMGLAGGFEVGFLDGDYEAVETGPDRAVFQRVTPAGLRIVKTWSASPDPFRGRLVVRFENAGASPLAGPLWVGVADRLEGTASRYANVARPSSVVDGSLETETKVKDILGTPVVRPGPVSWLGSSSRYFLAALVPEDPTWGTLTALADTEDHAGLYLVAQDVTLAPGQVREIAFEVFSGPKSHKLLAGIGHDLDRSVEYGIFGFFARLLLWLMQAFQTVLKNWGLSIIALTVFVKLAFYPLTQTSMRSSRNMQRIQPQLAEIKERYKDDRDMQTQETMRLFKEHKVNPLGGCLPMLIQLPVWFALYNVLLFSVDLYHSRFLAWRDLTAADPYAVLPILVGVLMFLQQQVTPMTGMDPTQAKMMRWMPLIFVFFMFQFPSGLGVYIVVNSVLSILQQWIVNRGLHPAPKPA